MKPEARPPPDRPQPEPDDASRAEARRTTATWAVAVFGALAVLLGVAYFVWRASRG